MHTNRSNIERTRQHIVHGSPRLYSFLLQARGSSVFNHCGQEARLTEGDFALCDSYAPHNFTIDDDSVVIMLRVGASTLKEHLPWADQCCGMALRSDVGLTRARSAMVEKLPSQLATGCTSVYADRFARHLREMLSMSYAIGFDQKPDVSAVLRGR